jgi:hypothetical protein
MRLIISGNIAPSEITEFNQTSPTHPGAPPGTVILPCASEVEGPITNVTVYPPLSSYDFTVAQRRLSEAALAAVTESEEAKVKAR